MSSARQLLVSRITGEVARRSSGLKVGHAPAVYVWTTRLCSVAQSTSVLCMASLLFDTVCVEGNCPRLCGVQECELVTRTELREDTCVAALA